VAPTRTAWVATKYGWQAAIAGTAASAVIDVPVWFAVKPDQPLVKRQSSCGGEKSGEAGHWLDLTSK